MTDPFSWPPPPETPNPLTAHDEFLSACVRNSTPKPQLSRLRLVRDLRGETGQDLRSCLAVVNDFCDRHTILMPLTGFKAWLPFLLTAVGFGVALVNNVTGYLLGKKREAAATFAERLALRSERVHLDIVLAGVLLVPLGLAVIAILYRQKKAKADAAEAVAKFAR